MSDDERDNDIESDVKREHHNVHERKRRGRVQERMYQLRDSIPGFSGGNKVRDKRKHHNELERERRSRLHERIYQLKALIPGFSGDNKASRAQILKKAADYIQSMRKKNSAHQQDIDDLKRQNKALEEQILLHSEYLD